MFRLMHHQQPVLSILLIVGASLILGQGHFNHSYSAVDAARQTVSIKMPKFLSYPFGFPSRGSDPILSSRPQVVNATNLPSHLGGLGLASGSQNRISLSALSKRPHQLEGDNVEPVAQRFSTHRQPPERTPSTSDDQSLLDALPVSVRVIGQSISTTLQPDLSPRKVRKLRRILAGSLDTKWTSETPPRVLRQRGLSGSLEEFDKNLVTEAERLNFTVRQPNGLQYSLTSRQVQFFRTWLVEMASCEMEYIWEDLGSLFWPRWIRRGVCVHTTTNNNNHNNNQENSCSWPPGMKCKPTGSRALTLLHWKCNEQAAEAHTAGKSMPVKPAGRTRRAFENRYQSHTVTNTFHSSFRDMDPVAVENSKISNKAEPHVSSLTGAKYTPFGRFKPGRFVGESRRPGYVDAVSSRAPRWSASRTRLPRGSFGGESRQERQKRRARRLIKRLSVTTNGIHCAWQTQSYLINDKCSCSCV